MGYGGSKFTDLVSTHSRPKAAGRHLLGFSDGDLVSTHSRPKAAGIGWLIALLANWFQHTAARRRLVVHRRAGLYISNVSTHSRPKAAGI